MPRKPETQQLLSTAANPRGTVTCLGRTFESDEARREHYLGLLAAKLKDPDFRATPGFPRGTDEAILRMSDPPYYTACPNPFVEDFVRFHGRPYDPEEEYSREPFAVDVSVGKTDALYKAHGYHTKVPHLAIVPSILHYTKPCDLVLDGFCGSGMTGVAAQWCGTAPVKYRRELEAEWKRDGREPPEWGARNVILGDLGPAATFIAANYNIPFDVDEFAEAAQRILDEVEGELGWMYKTQHTDGKTKGRINYTVWSEVFLCPECSTDVVFLKEALDQDTKRTRIAFPCPQCGASLNKKTLQRRLRALLDTATGSSRQTISLTPVLVDYSIGKLRHQKEPDQLDRETLRHVERLSLPAEVPTTPYPIKNMYHGSRLAPKGFTHTHHLFLPRPTQALAVLWRKAAAAGDHRLRNVLLYFVEQAIWGLSILSRYVPSHYSQVNQYLNGVYYVGSMISEVSPHYSLQLRLERLRKYAFALPVSLHDTACVTTADCTCSGVPPGSVDYIFTDPPFGENIYYADLNFLVESWHGVLTDPEPEAIVDRAKKKTAADYQELMRRCFEEYHRVLKPGRWMTVVFSNSKNAIWRAIQEAMGTAGFVIADVRTLDKKQGSFRQVTSSAVKQDLVISAYKPTDALADRFKLGAADQAAVWSFIDEHLGNLPVFVGRGDEVDIIAERTPQMLLDRMIAFYVQRRVAVPMGGPEFLAGLEQRYPRRDGMYFLRGQIPAYDRRRANVRATRQLELFVFDEASATQWVRQQLQTKPQSFQVLQPRFMQQAQSSWARHEKTVELKELLELNFLRYDGTGPVPSQVHGYLSTAYKDLRKLLKDDPRLRAKATGRWYVADPKKEGDLEKLRLRTLLKEFDEYRATDKRLIRLFRTEAVRAGFKYCYDEQDYQTIANVAAKLPDRVIQEDEKLLMYYDVAATRLAG